MAGDHRGRRVGTSSLPGGVRAAFLFMAAGMCGAFLALVAGAYATSTGDPWGIASIVVPWGILSMWIYIPGWLFLLADSREASSVRVPGMERRIPAAGFVVASGLLAWALGALAVVWQAADSGFLFVLLIPPFLPAYLPFTYAPIMIAHVWLFESWAVDAPHKAGRSAAKVGSASLVAAGLSGVIVSGLLVATGQPIGLALLAEAHGPIGIRALLVLPSAFALLGYASVWMAWAGRSPPKKGTDGLATAAPHLDS